MKRTKNLKIQKSLKKKEELYPKKQDKEKTHPQKTKMKGKGACKKAK